MAIGRESLSGVCDRASSLRLCACLRPSGVRPARSSQLGMEGCQRRDGDGLADSQGKSNARPAGSVVALLPRWTRWPKFSMAAR